MSNNPLMQQSVGTQEIFRTLVAIDVVMSNESSEVRSALEAASVPHWFDRAILLRLLDCELSSDFDQIFEKIRKSPFCEPFSNRKGFNVKKQFRAALRYRLGSQNPEQLRSITLRSIKAFSNVDPTHQAERAYHTLWADPSNAGATLTGLVDGLRSQDQALLQFAIIFRDCASADSMIPPTIAAWAYWVQARTQSLYLSNQESLELALQGFKLAKSGGDSNAISALSQLVAEFYTLMGKTKEAREFFSQASLGDHSPISADTPNSRAIFLSASTGEFESETGRLSGVRSNLRLFLSRADCEVKVQEEFRQTAVDTIQKLDAYICKCSAVVHLVGADPGDVADLQSVTKFLKAEQKFLSDYPKLRQTLGSCFELTYTQWEAFIALHRRVPLFVYSTPDAETGQLQHLDRLRSVGRYPEVFATAAELFGKLIGDLREIVPALPNQNAIAAAKLALSKLNQRFLATSNVDLINGNAIRRDETAKIMEAIRSETSNGALLVASAGSGKSCILAQLLDELTTKSIPHLAIKLDSLGECNNAGALGQELGLTDSPVSVLLRTAEGTNCVLIVDQLDAISTVSGRKTNTWSAFEELRRQAANCPGMKIVVACRDFDLEQDHRLRPLGDEQSGFKKIVVGLLSESQVREALNLARLPTDILTPQQLEILSLPLHLLLFLQGNPELPFHRVGDLYDHYWDEKRNKLRNEFGSDSHWTNVIAALTEYMSDNQSTYAPKDVVDEWYGVAQHLVSLHVLVDTGKDYRFFHESFFDYAFARNFSRCGESLLSFLTRPGEEQHLFRRAQVRQILGYRREHRWNKYLRDLTELMSSSSVRFHIQRMVATELRRVINPRIEEWRIIEPYLLDHELSPTIDHAIRGHEGWFDLLFSDGFWQQWLASNDDRFVDAAVWFLEAHELHKLRSEAIAQLLEPFLSAGDKWDQRLKRIFSWGVAHQSTSMKQIYFGLIRRGVYDDEKENSGGIDFWGNQYTAEKDNPQFIIDLVRCWFIHAVAKYDDGKSWNFLDKAPLNNSGTGCELLSNAVLDEPLYFIEQFLPLFVETVLATTVADRELMRNRAWPYLNNAGDPHDLNDSIFQQVRQVLERFAKNDISLFRQLVEPLKQYHHETFGYLLLMSYAANPAEFANECIEYLCAHQPRINIGYGIWSGGGHGESAVSREAIRAITPFCSKEMMKKLEDAVIGYADSYERETPGRRGFGELLVLRSIDSRARSDRVKVRISELECGFPNISDDLPPRDDQSMATWIGSPIPDDKASLMTDDQWLSAMKTYDGTTDRFKGGPVELSRVLTAKTRENRVRFAKLAMRMLDNVEPIYFSAILEGLCGSNDLPAEEKEADKKAMDSTPLELIEDVIRRVHAIPNSFCGSAIAHAIEKLADRELSPEVLRILSFYATNDPDPDSDIWQDKTQNYYGGDPFTHGINTVRGRAATAIGALLYAEESRFSTLRPAIEALANDPVISVRTCAISAIMPVLNFERDTAVQLFVGCCQDAEAIWATTPFDRFVHFAIHSHYSAFRNLLQSVLQSKNEKAVKSVSTRIVLADLSKVELGDDVLSIQTGNEWMRKAACHVYAHNIGHPEVGDRCAEVLQQYFNDNSEDVRKQIGHAFWKTDGDRLLQLESMISRFIESPSFESGAEELLRALAKSTVELPKVACRAAERVIDIIGNNGGDNRLRKMGIANSLSTLIVRQYAQSEDPVLKRHCLDLIDQMERLGFLGISEELSKIDR